MELPETRSQGPPLGTLGRYELLEKLGQGGMGTVYLAHDRKLDRRVAIKVLPSESIHDPDAVARFQREAKALAKLAHPGIVQAYDADAEGDRHFLVMEYVEGTSLARLLLDRGHLPPAVAADYVHQAALALQHAHEKGLVHRDLKPSNLLLTAEKRIKLLDLGLARFLQDQVDPGRTREGTGLGTPDYAAPEQFRDAHRADARSDIYALGCTLYHLLAGRVPFPGSSLSEKHRAHEGQPPAPVEDLCPEAPTGLALIVQRMMAKRPADRFQTAQEVADALAPYVSGASLSAARLKTTLSWHGGQLTLSLYPPRRRVMPWAVAAAAVVTCLAVLVIAWPRLFPSAAPPGVVGLPANGPLSGPASRQPEAPNGQPAPAASVDPNVLTVSKKAEAGGRFRTLGEALEKVRPGMTIRVLDSGTYAEALVLSRSTQAGITLEAPRHATIEFPAGVRLGVFVVNLPRITLRGFRLRAADNKCSITVVGRCPGLQLTELDIQPGRDPNSTAISFEKLELGPREAHVIVQDCRIHSAVRAVRVLGVANDYNTPLASGRVVIRNNQFFASMFGVVLLGAVHDVHIVGNRIVGPALSGVQFEDLLPGAGHLLVANNAFLECGIAVRLWDKAVKGEDIQVRNNLILQTSGPDIEFRDSGGDPQNDRGPGDGTAVARTWRIDHNWREIRSLQGLDRSWVPLGKQDVRQEHFEGLPRDPDRPDFLRPPARSPLATAGAGKEDPSLPAYVGAVPPEGTEPWDWDRTWQARSGSAPDPKRSGSSRKDR